MNAEYVNSFYKATKDVLKLMVDWDIEREGISAVEGIASKDANVVLGITGDLKGQVIFGFPNQVIFSMVSNMSGMKVEEMNAFTKSALGEVANIISGRAMTELASCGYTCDILPPKMILGECVGEKTKESIGLELEMGTLDGKFIINLDLKAN